MIQFGQVLPLGFEYTLLGNAGLDKYAFSVLVQPPGAFLMIGFLLAIITAIRQSKKTKGAKK
jgi:electron transport complex protein RnfE